MKKILLLGLIFLSVSPLAAQELDMRDPFWREVHGNLDFVVKWVSKEDRERKVDLNEVNYNYQNCKKFADSIDVEGAKPGKEIKMVILINCMEANGFKPEHEIEIK